MLSLKGNIYQTDWRKDKDFTLIFKYKNKEIFGKYGCSCWWIPLKETYGIKIFNTKKFDTVEEASIRLNSLRDRYIDLTKVLNDAKKYLPTVYKTEVIKHTGLFERGGTNRKTGENKNNFYPAFFMAQYDMPTSKQFDEKKVKKIIKAFEKRGLKLHRDTCRRQQVGINNDSYVILDVADIHQKKWL